ncbi:rCG58793 [Rattus norvegicus]|uniref:RCG58793 n=1 Tax=Rattus norvegicus TaxID=10116 RepID=A6JL90_RAT|nr:rCG58793 [Rattus norvegicus]
MFSILEDDIMGTFIVKWKDIPNTTASVTYGCLKWMCLILELFGRPYA